MEIQTAPRPPASTSWGRLLLFAALLGPVTLFVLLPTGLGLQRYVMTGDSMAGSIDRGSVAFERVVPVSDVHVGDVVTYKRTDADGRHMMVTHRVVAIRTGGIVTRGDAEPAADPWVLRSESSTVSRVVFTVPWIGWAYLLLANPWGWVVTVASAVLLLALTRLHRRRRGPTLRESDPATDASTGREILVDARAAGFDRGEP